MRIVFHCDYSIAKEYERDSDKKVLTLLELIERITRSMRIIRICIYRFDFDGFQIIHKIRTTRRSP